MIKKLIIGTSLSLSVLACDGNSKNPTSSSKGFRSQASGYSMFGFHNDSGGICVAEQNVDEDTVSLITQSGALSEVEVRKAVRVSGYWAHMGWSTVGFVAGGIATLVTGFWGLPLLIVGAPVGDYVANGLQDDHTAGLVAMARIFPLGGDLFAERAVRGMRKETLLIKDDIDINQRLYRKFKERLYTAYADQDGCSKAFEKVKKAIQVHEGSLSDAPEMTDGVSEAKDSNSKIVDELTAEKAKAENEGLAPIGSK